MLREWKDAAETDYRNGWVCDELDWMDMLFDPPDPPFCCKQSEVFRLVSDYLQENQWEMGE